MSSCHTALFNDRPRVEFLYQEKNDVQIKARVGITTAITSLIRKYVLSSMHPNQGKKYVLKNIGQL